MPDEVEDREIDEEAHTAHGAELGDLAHEQFQPHTQRGPFTHSDRLTPYRGCRHYSICFMLTSRGRGRVRVARITALADLGGSYERAWGPLADTATLGG
ncbi:hypothetical protein GCM10023324_46140 [Streptomyces youssoufiensis]